VATLTHELLLRGFPAGTRAIACFMLINQCVFSIVSGVWLQKKNLEPLDKSVKKFLEQSFTITNTPGTNRFTLVRKEGDSEKVTIIVDAGNPEWVEEDGTEQEEGGNTEDARDTHFFYTTVVVQKPGAANMLVFETFIGEVSGVDIRNVHYAPAGADLDTLGSKAEYTGPVYDELDEELRASFEDYLTSLGVDFEFAAAAFKMADHKENAEYAAWLSNVAEYLQ
jgi:complement component 1 Q subcomponent-binding protein, mitochondrial